MAKSRRKIYKKRKGTKRRYKGGGIIKPGGIGPTSNNRSKKVVKFGTKIKKREWSPKSGVDGKDYSEENTDTIINYAEPRSKVSPGNCDDFFNYPNKKWDQYLTEFNKERNPSLFRSFINFCTYNREDPNFVLSALEKEMYNCLSEMFEKGKFEENINIEAKNLLDAMRKVFDNETARKINCDNVLYM